MFLIRRNLFGLKLIFIATVFFIGCSKKNSTIESKDFIDNLKSSHQQILSNINSRSTESLNDPLLCKDDPHGYLYLKVGDEIFRMTKDSSIYIKSVMPDHMRLHKNKKTNVPEGCEGNPYIYPDVIIEIRHNSKEPEWHQIKFDEFNIYPVDKSDAIAVNGLYFIFAGKFEAIKKLARNCGEIKDFEKCVFYGVDKKSVPPVAYKSESYLVLGKPFYFVCSDYVGEQKCGTAYFLYPSVRLNYSFMLVKNIHWKEENIISFDKYIHNLFESIRVQDRRKI